MFQSKSSIHSYNEKANILRLKSLLMALLRNNLREIWDGGVVKKKDRWIGDKMERL